MILSQDIIKDIKEKSNLMFDKAADFNVLTDEISKETGRTIGLTTIKRLFGYIDDDRKTSQYTLNTLALYLGYSDWKEYSRSKNLDSDWNFDTDKVLIAEQTIGTMIHVKYLDRIVTFVVTEYDNQKVLRVEKAENSSLKVNDILFVNSLQVGNIIEADKVIRGKNIGNYRTHGEISEMHVE